MLNIRPAKPKNIPTIKRFIADLAEYENLTKQVCITEKDLTRALFKEKSAHAIIAEEAGIPVGHAVFFTTSPHFFAKKAFLQKIYILCRICAAVDLADRFSDVGHALQKIKTAAAWNGTVFWGINLL